MGLQPHLIPSYQIGDFSGRLKGLLSKKISYCSQSTGASGLSRSADSRATGVDHLSVNNFNRDNLFLGDAKALLPPLRDAADNEPEVNIVQIVSKNCY